MAELSKDLNPGTSELRKLHATIAVQRNKLAKLLTLDELAKRWSMSPKTIRNHISQGKLPIGTKPAGRWLFSIGEVLSLEKERRRND